MDIQRIQEILESIGMNKNEILIYLDLIKASSSSAHDISNRTKIHRPNVYDTLDKMIKKGIVTSSIENGKKIFYPIEPNNLLEYLKQREYDLKEVIPEIEKFRTISKQERKIEMAEGIRAIRNILNSFIDDNQPIYVYGIPKTAIEDIGGFINDFHQRRIEKNIPMRHIYNKNAEKRIRELNQMNLTEARYLPSLFDTNTTTNICGDRVVLFFWEPPCWAIIIKNESIANAYKKYFDILWEEAKISV